MPSAPNTRLHTATIIGIAAVLLALAASHTAARIIFVDGSLAADCPAGYDYVTRSCGGGSYTAYRRLKSAADIAVAGDTVVLRGGTYNEQLAPKNSGTAAAPIIYSSPGAEQVIITGASLAPAIWIYRLEHIVVQGIIVKDVQRWLAVLGSHHITIRSNGFLNANDAGGSSKTGLFFQGSDYNVITKNVIDNSTQDNLALVQSDHNLVEGNRITRAAHTLWAIKCGSYNVLRNNYFHNEYQKIGEIYDCDNVGYGDEGFPKVTSPDDTKHNVVEENIFAYTATPINASPYAGIQHAGQGSIIRRNRFYRCLGPALDLTLYADEARYNYGNRIYNNVFFDNHFGGASISGVEGAGFVFADNVFRNNVFHRNNFVQYDTRWEWYNTLNGKPVQIMLGGTAGVRFERNIIYDTPATPLWVVAYGVRTSSSNPPPQTLAWWETNQPGTFSGNLEADPMFADTSVPDFTPLPSSPLINGGIFLARTAGTGTSSTTMAVDDAGYFRDGFGIPGLGGDTVQLEGSSERAVIIGIDYAANTLTLDRSLSWTNGQGLNLKYSGGAPDLGVIESEMLPNDVAGDAAAEAIVLYPNPTTGRCTIRFPEGTSFTPRIRVADMYGRIVHTESRRPAAGSTCAIDLGHLPPGAYALLIETGSDVVARMCVRQ